VLIRSGTVAINIDGVEVRKISDGQAIGEDMLCNTSQTWAISAICVTPCDVQILHRQLFLPLVRGMQNGTSDDRSESQRLQYLLDGRWKENLSILSWPLFRGYAEELLTDLAHCMETRIVLPERKIWEGGPTGFEAIGNETALYFVLAGSCDEVSFVEREVPLGVDSLLLSDIRKIRRNITQGVCIGSREFLGIRENMQSYVTTKSICLLAVLHRSVLLHVLDGLTNQQKRVQSEEVVSILEEDLQSTRPDEAAGMVFADIARNLPLFSACDRQLLDRLGDTVARLFCITGQRLCLPGVDMDAMFVIARGSAVMLIDGLEIRKYGHGEYISALAFNAEGFTPNYAFQCEGTSEVWSVHRQDFLRLLDAFPAAQAHFSTLVKARLAEPSLQSELGKPDGVLLPLSKIDKGLFYGCHAEYLQ
jgi:hypothetical protein